MPDLQQCHPAIQWAERCGLEHAGQCFGLQYNYSGKDFFFLLLKESEGSLFRGSALLSQGVCERACVTAADSVPMWRSDFAFSSILKTCWW